MQDKLMYFINILDTKRATNKIPIKVVEKSINRNAGKSVKCWM